jgi:hypothetical protein
MPSETRLDTVRATLVAAIKPALPKGWKVVEHLKDPAAKQLTPIVYTEFTGISSEHNGQAVPPGIAFCDFDLSVTVASTDDRKGEDDVDAAVLDLILAVDAAPDMAWESAKKQRLDTGQLLWRLTLSVITHTN